MFNGWMVIATLTNNYHNSERYPSSCLLFKAQLSSIGLSVPHRKHITCSPRAQQVNPIYRFVTMVSWYNHNNSEHYPSYCLLFKTQLNLQVYPYLTENILHVLYEPNSLMVSTHLWRCYLTITTLHIIQRPVFYLRTSQKALRLRYEPNRLMLSIGLWRWYIIKLSKFWTLFIVLFFI
jgi:hypothetical protein